VAHHKRTGETLRTDSSRLLTPGKFIDCDAEPVLRFVARAFAAHAPATPADRAVRLFEAVRDGVRYDPYRFVLDPVLFRASAIADADAAFCVPKAILLTACLRAVDIPAAIGFADVRNHLTSDKLAARMGTDLFTYHGYVQLWLDGRTFKVTPAFNASLCLRFGVKPLVFDGRSDALFHEFDARGRRHMEYLADHGIFEDVPIETLFAVYRAAYPRLADSALARAGDDEVFTH